MLYRAGVVLVAGGAGIAAGALVFKVVGEERIGSEIGVVATRLGFKAGGADGLDLVEKIAPGTKASITGAVVGTVIASLLVATAVTIAIRELAAQ